MSEKPCSLSIQCSVRKPLSVELLGRREWVKCFALGWAAAVGLGTRSRLLADISAGANVANVIELKLADFPVLQDAYGSVRLALLIPPCLAGS